MMSQIVQLSDTAIGNLVSQIQFGCETVQGHPESFRHSSKACENDPTSGGTQRQVCGGSCQYLGYRSLHLPQ